jgi:hypothetical protein
LRAGAGTFSSGCIRDDRRTAPVSERWETDEDLSAARERFAAAIPGFVHPAAYAVARRDGERLTFGHVNEPGGMHRLPATVLASGCGYVATTGVYPLSREQLADAVERLAPAEAATHWAHPNLWSWRELLADGRADSAFLAFFLADTADPPVDDDDAQFRRVLPA